MQAIERDGTAFEFDTFADYQAALTAGDASRGARIIGRQPNYRHGNNVYAERDDGMRRRYFANPPLYKPEFRERVEERLTREGNTLRYEVTVHDPAVLLQPWEMDPILLGLNPGTETYLEDPPCLDFDAAHMVTRERG